MTHLFCNNLCGSNIQTSWQSVHPVTQVLVAEFLFKMDSTFTTYVSLESTFYSLSNVIFLFLLCMSLDSETREAIREEKWRPLAVCPKSDNRKLMRKWGDDSIWGLGRCGCRDFVYYWFKYLFFL